MLVRNASSADGYVQNDVHLPFPMHTSIRMISCRTCSNRHSSDSYLKAERDRHWHVFDNNSLYWYRWIHSTIDQWTNSEQREKSSENEPRCIDHSRVALHVDRVEDIWDFARAFRCSRNANRRQERIDGGQWLLVDWLTQRIAFRLRKHCLQISHLTK